MKQLLLIAIAGMCVACAPVDPQVDKEKESAAIQATIERFLQAHAERDYETWGDIWVHEPYVFFSAISTNYDYFAPEWTNIYIRTRAQFMRQKTMDEQLGRSQSIEPSDYQLRIYKDSACAQFKITWTTYKDGAEPETYVSRDFYTFEKIAGQWKVASIIAVNTTAYQPPTPPLPELSNTTEPVAPEIKRFSKAE